MNTINYYYVGILIIVRTFVENLRLNSNKSIIFTDGCRYIKKCIYKINVCIEESFSEK